MPGVRPHFHDRNEMTIMYARLFFLSLLLFEFVQCGRPAGLRTESPAVPTRRTPGRPEPGNALCDFSSFHPVTLSGLGGLGAPAISKPQPAYPPEAKARGIEGLVKIKVLLNTRGEVERACVLEGDETLGQAALGAALRSRFGSLWSKQMVRAGSSYGEGVITYRFVPQ